MFNIREHLNERFLDLSLYDKDNCVIVDDDFNMASFMLYSPAGEFVGYQTYNPLGDKKKRKSETCGKYFTKTTKGKLGLWGLEFVNSPFNIMFITEGCFKACRFHLYGYMAIATLTKLIFLLEVITEINVSIGFDTFKLCQIRCGPIDICRVR